MNTLRFPDHQSDLSQIGLLWCLKGSQKYIYRVFEGLSVFRAVDFPLVYGGTRILDHEENGGVAPR